MKTQRDQNLVFSSVDQDVSTGAIEENYIFSLIGRGALVPSRNSF